MLASCCRNGPLWEVWGIEFRRGTSMSIPFLGLGLPCGVQKHQKCEKTMRIDQKTWFLIHLVSRICFSPKESAHRKKAFFPQCLGSVIFSLCFLPSAARSLKRTKNTRGSKLGFWDPLAHFEVKGGRNFCSGYVSKKKKASVTTCCLSLWCRRRVSSSHVVIIFESRKHF